MDTSNKVNLRLFHNIIAVKPHEEADKSSGGVFLPETARKGRPQEGIVCGIADPFYGDDGLFVGQANVPIKIGDTVLYSKYAGMETKIDEVAYLLLPWRDVLAARPLE